MVMMVVMVFVFMLVIMSVLVFTVVFVFALVPVFMLMPVFFVFVMEVMRLRFSLFLIGYLPLSRGPIRRKWLHVRS